MTVQELEREIIFAGTIKERAMMCLQLNEAMVKLKEENEQLKKQVQELLSKEK